MSTVVNIRGVTQQEASTPPSPCAITGGVTLEPEALTVHDTIEAGATYGLDVYLKDELGAALDISGCTAELQLRRCVTDATADLTLTSSPAAGLTITGTAGLISIAMTPEQTSALSGAYVYALELTWPSTDVERVIEGTMRVSPEVVR